MNRLKFRAWDDENLCWVRPRLIENESGVTVDERGFELFQWTGLHDCEGAMIFEGDVIDRDVNCLWDDGRKKDVVTFINGSFCASRGPISIICDGFRPLVVGNIYENPELVQ